MPLIPYVYSPSIGALGTSLEVSPIPLERLRGYPWGGYGGTSVGFPSALLRESFPHRDKVKPWGCDLARGPLYPHYLSYLLYE